MVEFTSMTSASDTIYLLRDVEQVEGDKFTASLVETISDFKGNITLTLDESSKYDSVVYFIHGFQNHAHIPIFMSQTHNNKADSTSLMIPYLWRNPWEAIAINYCIANCYAKEAGRTLSSAHDIFSGVDYKQSLILHSMGNYLTSFYLSEVLASGQVIEPVFTNVYMVAPDIRHDVFSIELNPAATNPSLLEEKRVKLVTPFNESPGSSARIETYCRTEEEEDTGYLITLISTGKIYVLHNANDFLMHLGLTQICGFQDKRLGLYGTEGEAVSRSEYFTRRVSFVDVTCLAGYKHVYMFDEYAYSIYNHDESDTLQLPCQ